MNRLIDYQVLTCKCSEGSYLGAQMMGTPVRCERCGFITAEQMWALKAQAWDEGYEAAQRDEARANSNPWHTDECDCLTPTANPYMED